MDAPVLRLYGLHAFRERSEDQMYDRFRLGAAWMITFALCGVLITTAYWNLYWGIVPVGR